MPVKFLPFVAVVRGTGLLTLRCSPPTKGACRHHPLHAHVHSLLLGQKIILCSGLLSIDCKAGPISAFGGFIRVLEFFELASASIAAFSVLFEDEF